MKFPAPSNNTSHPYLRLQFKLVKWCVSDSQTQVTAKMFEYQYTRTHSKADFQLIPYV